MFAIPRTWAENDRAKPFERSYYTCNNVSHKAKMLSTVRTGAPCSRFRVHGLKTSGEALRTLLLNLQQRPLLKQRRFRQ